MSSNTRFPTPEQLDGAILTVCRIIGQLPCFHFYEMHVAPRFGKKVEEVSLSAMMNNAALDSALINLRCLHEFFCDLPRNDDIRCCHFGNAMLQPFLVGGAEKEIHKHLAHVTATRAVATQKPWYLDLMVMAGLQRGAEFLIFVVDKHPFADSEVKIQAGEMIIAAKAALRWIARDFANSPDPVGSFPETARTSLSNRSLRKTNCHHCAGSGFTNPKNRGICRSCIGRGWVELKPLHEMICPECLGEGSMLYSDNVQCHVCHGKGYEIAIVEMVPEMEICVECDENGQVVETADCPECEGSGLIDVVKQHGDSYTTRCQSCEGTGSVEKTVTCPVCKGRGEFESDRLMERIFVPGK